MGVYDPMNMVTQPALKIFKDKMCAENSYKACAYRQPHRITLQYYYLTCTD